MKGASTVWTTGARAPPAEREGTARAGLRPRPPISFVNLSTNFWRCSMSDKPTIVFAHGLWADGSCYSKVIPLLQADGFEVIATQNHLNTVADDAAAVATSFARASGPVVLVGHSYRGTVITAAGADARVAAPGYFFAPAPEGAATAPAAHTQHPPTAIFHHLP